MGPYEPAAFVNRFPLLAARPELIYLDSAATTQRLDSVLARLECFYREENSNVHRGTYDLAAGATAAYEDARTAIASYVQATSPEEIIFVRGTTEAINLVAHCWGPQSIGPGDLILTTAMEHHSNFLPWQRVAAERGAQFRVCGLTERGELDLEDLDRHLAGGRTKLLAVAHVSNVLGTVNPIKKIAAMAHGAGALVLVDGARRADSGPIDVADLGCDFYAFSGHKMFAGTGIGVLWGRKDLLERMEPYQLGGGMVETVTEKGCTCRSLPEKFEAGTPHVAGALGLHCAVDFLKNFPWDSYDAYRRTVGVHLESALREIPGLRLLGSPTERAGVYAVFHGGVHGHDLATALATKGICVRAGHHCAQPLHRLLGIAASLRASFSIYNSLEQAEKFVETLRWAVQVLS
ncbi:MAG: cysteine desulfurase [Puniceicoccales bacterium]|jgi:cysteine desulfurase/selenocysteine lyase|nr:cysteine desulfurase [Puniceicoccales bacterium]